MAIEGPVTAAPLLPRQESQNFLGYVDISGACMASHLALSQAYTNLFKGHLNHVTLDHHILSRDSMQHVYRRH
jgi:hypothetical protein